MLKLVPWYLCKIVWLLPVLGRHSKNRQEALEELSAPTLMHDSQNQKAEAVQVPMDEQADETGVYPYNGVQLCL